MSRTQLREDTTTALFILDALHPITDVGIHAAPRTSSCTCHARRQASHRSTPHHRLTTTPTRKQPRRRTP